MAIFAHGDVAMMVALVLCSLTITSTRQVIRLRSGLECSQPGYFRDVEDCTRFYHCPSQSLFIRTGPLSDEERHIVQEIVKIGAMCPDEAIFNEDTQSCENIRSITSIPPECKPSAKSKNIVVDEQTVTAVPEIFNNEFA